MKILVIDDEKPTLSMFRLFLTAYGYEVFTAEDGEKGLQLFDELQPDIVFTDIKMPGMDGLEVLRKIRNSGAHTQVIIITGHGDMEKAVEALDLDASDFINKPVERHALSSALIRAEKRMQTPEAPPFEFFEMHTDHRHTLYLNGRLTAVSGAFFLPWLKSLDPGSGETREVTLVFNELCSIDSSGIGLLMDVLQKLKQKRIPVILDNLAYNYLKIFEMAGMDKCATLREMKTDDEPW